jgi:hypothetical protein
LYWRLFSVCASCDDIVGLLTELRAKATEKKPASKPNNENKMTSRESFMKNQIVVSVEVHAQENAHNGKILSPNQGRYFYVFLFCINRIITK